MNAHQQIISHFPTQQQRRRAMRILMHFASWPKCFQSERVIANATQTPESQIHPTIDKLIRAKLVHYEYTESGMRAFTCNKKTRPYIVVDLESLHLPPTTFLIAHRLLKEDGKPISIPRLARLCFCTDRQAQRAIHQLEKIGILQAKQSKPYLPKKYQLTPPQKPAKTSKKSGEIDGNRHGDVATSPYGDVDGDVDGDVADSPPPLLRSTPPPGDTNLHKCTQWEKNQKKNGKILQCAEKKSRPTFRKLKPNPTAEIQPPKEECAEKKSRPTFRKLKPNQTAKIDAAELVEKCRRKFESNVDSDNA